MRKQYLECGKIVSVHGVRGEVRVMPWCDSPEYLCGFRTLYLKSGAVPLAVERARAHKSMVLLKLSGIDDMDAAATLRGAVLYIDRNDDPVGDGAFIQDLTGLEVLDADSGKRWGRLVDVFPTGANDVYVIEDGSGKQLLAPAIPDVIAEIDTEGGVMRIRPLKGLFEDED